MEIGHNKYEFDYNKFELGDKVKVAGDYGKESYGDKAFPTDIVKHFYTVTTIYKDLDGKIKSSKKERDFSQLDKEYVVDWFKEKYAVGDMEQDEQGRYICRIPTRLGENTHILEFQD